MYNFGVAFIISHLYLALISCKKMADDILIIDYVYFLLIV